MATVYLIPCVLAEDAMETIPAYVLDAVKNCSVIFAENERTARRFLKNLDQQIVIDDFEWFAIHKAEETQLLNFKSRIKENKNIAIISEAGCPGIADPGQVLIAAAQEMAADPEMRDFAEEEIKAGDWLYIPFEDPSHKIIYTSKMTFGAKEGYENHPMTMVTWFGAWSYCGYYGWRLPTEMEWEKAARGTDTRPFPWGDEILRENANFYSSRDPFEDMSSFGSRTNPVGFYNGQKYGDYQTLNSASPYGLYDMAGNVWQWTGNVYEGMHYRFMRGGSKDTYDMDLRLWVRNNATPTYYSPGVGFRCVR